MPKPSRVMTDTAEAAAAVVMNLLIIFLPYWLMQWDGSGSGCLSVSYPAAGEGARTEISRRPWLGAIGPAHVPELFQSRIVLGEGHLNDVAILQRQEP